MKEYKLIKKYPSLPTNWEEGMEVGQGDRKNGTYSPCNGKYENNNGIILLLSQCEVENNPEFWEEVIEKDYKILRVTPKPNHPNLPVGTIIDSWVNINMDYFDIYSVKRLSDGEVFTIGDNYIQTLNGRKSIIKEIVILEECQNKLCLFSPELAYSSLYESEKIKQPLFTTEDGVDIFEDNNLWIFQKDHTIMQWKQCIKKGITTNEKYFSTKEAAEEYSLMNKPCLSINDLENLRQNIENKIGLQLVKDAKELVKNRL